MPSTSLRRPAVSIAFLALLGCTPQPTLIGWQRADGALLNPRDQQRADLTCKAIAANAGAAVPLPQPAPQAPQINVSQTTTIYAPPNLYAAMMPPSPQYSPGPPVDFSGMGASIGHGIATVAARRRQDQVAKANYDGCMAQNGYLPIYESAK
jgi:hypothetical protein